MHIAFHLCEKKKGIWASAREKEREKHIKMICYA